MVFSIWRLSHLTLAISSFVFILIASITGIILAIEPISEKLRPYNVDLENISLAKTISNLEKEYDEVFSIKKDYNNHIITSVITKEGTSEQFYVNPHSGEKIGYLVEKAPIYKFATNLHRSLFLKTTGRIIIGVVSFILLMIAITGLLLIIKRQGGIAKFFSKVVKEDIYQYYHVILGRISLIPIILITITGVYLSLEKFSLLPENKIVHKIKEPALGSKKMISEFLIFKSTRLKDLKILEFPFSKDKEDTFYLKLQNKELIINQYSGEILSTIKYPFVVLASSISLSLHTGRGSFLWSLVLFLSAASILFFIFSGFIMTFQRKRKINYIPANVYNKKDAEYLILVGSETGNTYLLAKALFDALKKAHKKVFITDLNKYTTFKNLKHLFILTATYGSGEAPSNSEKFLKKINTLKPIQKVEFSVIGFGSLAYPDFCQFAIDIDTVLINKLNFNQTIPIHKIHNQNYNDFLNWSFEWSKKTKIPLKINAKNKKPEKLAPFMVVNKTALNEDNTFIIQIKPAKKTIFKAGDLLEIAPNEDSIVRYYSIGSLNNDIILSVKKHSLGVCSNYLNEMKQGSIFFGKVKKNKEFHFPNQYKEVILIANGTGIAPFLGMLNENTNQIPTHLFWGGRKKSSFKLYKDFITQAIQKKQLNSLNIAYSREGKTKKYVQQLIEQNSEIIVRVLSQNGVIMICGSLAMETGVKKILSTITESKMNLELEKFKNQIRTDCY